MKIWADGGMSSRTAAIHGNYPVPPFGSGIMYFDPAELTAMVGEFAARGFQVCIHAQGDRAIEIVLDAYAHTLARTRGNPRRHRIEHGGAMYPALTARAAELAIPVVSSRRPRPDHRHPGTGDRRGRDTHLPGRKRHLP